VKYMIAALFLATLAMSGCSSLADVKGPYARSSKGASTQIDAPTEEVERNPFPQATDHGLF
jgi:hypothetical protein